MKGLASAFSGLLFALCVLAAAVVIWSPAERAQTPAPVAELPLLEAPVPLGPEEVTRIDPEILLPIPDMPGLVRPRARPEGWLTDPVDRVVIDKGARRMWVERGGKVIRAYPIALGFAPDGDKVREGDGKTPEGIFRVNRRNPQSSYHLSLGINYPQADDIARGRAGGYSPGGDIMIHGQPNGRKSADPIRRDWTAGCIAVSNAEIEELWRIVPHGTVVEIRP